LDLQTIMTRFTKITILFLFSLFTLPITAQKEKGKSYAECAGEINLFKSNVYDIQFLGITKSSTVFANYPALKNVKSGNQVWFSFIAPANGKIILTASKATNGLSLLVFDAKGENLTTELAKGNAELVRMIIPEHSCTAVGLSDKVTETFFAPVKIKEGKVLSFALIADPGVKEKVTIDFKFVPDDDSFSEFAHKEQNMKFDDFAQSLVVKVRDKSTNNPIVPTIKLNGVKGIEGVYHCSDLTLDLTKNGKLSVNLELEGYFIIDTLIPVNFNQTKEILLKMEPIRSGKSFQIEDIEFEPGTSKILDKSLPKLKRLRDFLVLNAMVSVEIQGHVFEIDQENSLAGQKMSEARAQRVMKYLVDNGINKNRLTAVGYGSTKPLFPSPKNFGEEQANRRVEVVVK
jgi:outer membrane protein OmpA-like peptidoglycan-associated protein